MNLALYCLFITTREISSKYLERHGVMSQTRAMAPQIDKAKLWTLHPSHFLGTIDLPLKFQNNIWLGYEDILRIKVLSMDNNSAN